MDSTFNPYLYGNLEREQECFTVCALCYSSNNTPCIICAVVTEYVEVGILGSDHQLQEYIWFPPFFQILLTISSFSITKEVVLVVDSLHHSLASWCYFIGKEISQSRKTTKKLKRDVSKTEIQKEQEVTILNSSSILMCVCMCACVMCLWGYKEK